MNSLKNRVTLIGNLGQDPEVRSTESGRKVANFTLATDSGYKNSEGQKVSETAWHNIVAWNGLAEIAGRYLKKGKQVAVEGRIAYRNYEDKKGITRYVTEIIVSDLLMLGSVSDNNGNDTGSESGKDGKK
jgi:single-strand DNA-binding protein